MNLSAKKGFNVVKSNERGDESVPGQAENRSNRDLIMLDVLRMLLSPKLKTINSNTPVSLRINDITENVATVCEIH